MASQGINENWEVRSNTEITKDDELYTTSGVRLDPDDAHRLEVEEDTIEGKTGTELKISKSINAEPSQQSKKSPGPTLSTGIFQDWPLSVSMPAFSHCRHTVCI